MPTAWTASIAAVVAGALVASCQVTTTLPCPASLILRNASQVTRFYPGRPETPENVRYVAAIDQSRLNCTYDSDNYERIEVALGIQLSAHRPPGLPADTADLRYFVAIVNLQGTVLARREFPVHFAFRAGETSVSDVETVQQTIPVKYPQNGGSLQVWVGYQLSNAELQYNREHPVP